MANNIAAAKMMAYDDSFLYKCSLYDNLPYVRTYERCNETTVCLFSGNVIKNMCYNIAEPVEISNRDDEFRYVLENMRLEASVAVESDYEESEDPDDNDEIVQGLMSEYVEEDE